MDKVAHLKVRGNGDMEVRFNMEQGLEQFIQHPTIYEQVEIQFGRKTHGPT